MIYYLKIYPILEGLMSNKFRKIMSAILALLCIVGAVSVTSCNSGNGNADTATGVTTVGATTAGVTTAAPNTYSKNTYKTGDVLEKLNVLGRCVLTDNGLTADWSASGIEFVADCKNMVKITVNASRDCRFNFYMDDAEMKAINVTAGKKTYTLVNNLDAGVHKFRFVKSSMVEHGTVGVTVEIESIELYGELGDATAREHYIEFIGDSITCGVGASSAASTEAYSELSYAYLAANKLDADYSLVSISGIGAGKSTDRHGGLLMGEVYSLNNYYRSKTDKYEPSRKADLVVINLNTNDKGSFDQVSMKEQFVAKVKDLIDQVKALHGEDVKIVWVMGMMNDPSYLYVDAWTMQYLRSLGGEEAGYYYFLAEKNNAGASSHPIASAHASVANSLAEFINSKGILG